MKKYLLAFLFILASCMDENVSPEGTLKSFIQARFGNVVTRQFILDRVTGKMQQSLENMGDQDFEKFADLRNVKQDSFKILSKSCQEKQCFLTYSVAYNTTEKSKFTSEVKKIAELTLVDGKWRIADVTNIKTYHEAQEPINPLE